MSESYLVVRRKLTDSTEYCDIITEQCQLYLPGPQRSNWERKCCSIATYKRKATLVLFQLVGESETGGRREGGMGLRRRKGREKEGRRAKHGDGREGEG